jgi:hypothetical protein
MIVSTLNTGLALSCEKLRSRIGAEAELSGEGLTEGRSVFRGIYPKSAAKTTAEVRQIIKPAT